MCRHRNGRVSTAAIAFGPWLRCLLKPCKVGTRPNECDSQHVGLDQAQNSSNQKSARFVSTVALGYGPRPLAAGGFLVSYTPLAVAAQSSCAAASRNISRRLPASATPTTSSCNYTFFLRAAAASRRAESRYSHRTKTKKIPLMTIDAVCRNL